jgi:hypothetical protein
MAILISFPGIKISIEKGPLEDGEIRDTTTTMQEFPIPESYPEHSNLEEVVSNFLCSEAGQAWIACIEIGDNFKYRDHDLVIRVYVDGMPKLNKTIPINYFNQFKKKPDLVKKHSRFQDQPKFPIHERLEYGFTRADDAKNKFSLTKAESAFDPESKFGHIFPRRSRNPQTSVPEDQRLKPVKHLFEFGNIISGRSG